MKIREILENAEQQLSELLKDSNGRSGFLDGCYKVFDTLLENIKTEFDDCIAISIEQADAYASPLDLETLCKLQFIQMMKNELQANEIKHLLVKNENNKLVKRALMPLCKKRDIQIKKDEFEFSKANNLINQKERMVKLLNYARDLSKDTIMDDSMNDLLKEIYNE